MTILPSDSSHKESSAKHDDDEEAKALDELAEVTVESELNMGEVKSEQASQALTELPKEINGPKGLEPTRYGDWESKGRCHDF